MYIILWHARIPQNFELKTTAFFHHSVADQILSHDKFFFKSFESSILKKKKKTVIRKSTGALGGKFQVPNFGFIAVNQSVTRV